MSLKDDMKKMSHAVKVASKKMANAPANVKRDALLNMAVLITENEDLLVKENKKDLEGAEKKGLSKAMIDRLALGESRILAMADGLREVAGLPDPVGEISKIRKRPSGIQVGKMRIPLGVIGIIYEARPNVTADAAGLCAMSGNAVILRGGSESIHSNRAVAKLLQQGLEKAGLPKDAVSLVQTTEREAVLEMLQLEEDIDLIIPRGGEGLIRFVVENSKIPVIKHYKGVCHIFVDEGADHEKALNIVMNAKTQRPGVCNAVETLLVHEKEAEVILPLLAAKFNKAGVEMRGCERSRKIVSSMKKATEEDWHTEYLDLVIAVRVVHNMDGAIEHINEYCSLHTESIITEDYTRAMRFIREVNSSVVMANASTRFSDGGQFGLGAEIGISTTKLHSFGPMGVEDLTTEKFIVLGEGQIRE
ncbi:MAG: glutamate-5-semialdehyde dehydrogenase [Deltaproteobacteria bacterium]|nr:glutamate-5-semialdehyde dehydrogenase [Deltaproteobacteria bacterium]